jgi:hypothetical protein
VAGVGRSACRRWFLAAAASLICALQSAPHAWADSHILDNDPEVPLLSNYGGAGLLDTRSARFMPDGYFSTSALISQPDDRFALTFQALPWMELTFRYAINNAIKDTSFSPPLALHDRSFDIKFRLSQETAAMPELAIGLQDFIGTGAYSGEYLVASKRFGDLDFSAGLGWGRLGTGGAALPNPLGLLFHQFDTRPTDSGGTGGTVSVTSFFRGKNVALFGGVQYLTPIRNLSVVLEYSSDRYLAEKQSDGKDFSFPVNVGLNYRPWPGVDFGISWLHKNQLGVRADFFFNPEEDTSSQRSDPMPPFVARDPDAVALLRRARATNPIPGAAPLRFIDLTEPAITQTLNERTLSSATPLATAVPKSIPDAEVASVTPKPIPGFKFVDLTQPEEKSALTAQLIPKEAPLIPQADEPVRLMLAAFVQPSTDPTNTSSFAFSEPTSEQQPEDADNDAKGTMVIALEAQSLEVEGIHIYGDRLSVIIDNEHYRRDTEAVARAARVLSAMAPARIAYFDITTFRKELLLTTVTLTRDQIDSLASEQSSPDNLWLSTIFKPASPNDWTEITHSYPRLDAHYLYPFFDQGYFDPNNPFYFRIGLAADATVTLFPGFAVEGAADGALIDTFNQITRGADSVLPHVRTDVAQYLKKGKYGFSDLQASYTFQPTPELYARLAAGYLEDMFAGVGGELLYRPFGERWALGLDIWDVRQRAFDRLFALHPYQVITGQLTLYYDLPWHDVSLRIHAGRYLAGDYGATFEAVRRFDTGVEIGAWFTLTNVSAQRFGEGSFDKGIIIRIPLEWAGRYATQSVYDLELRSVQRDGGQRLNNVERLYDTTESSTYGAIMNQWNSAFEP